MTTLAEFLKAKAQQLRSEGADRTRKRTEWEQAIKKLLEQLEAWLQQADSEKVVRVSRFPVEKREEGLGYYVVQGLELECGDQVVKVTPIASSVAGTVRREGSEQRYPVKGLVDITAEGEKFSLLRLVDEHGEAWHLLDEKSFSAVPWNRAAFEDVLLKLLQ
jgi:hypothetical protein